MFELTGKRALVCGSTQGIGRACAELLARQGASVVLAARDDGALRAAVASLDRSAGQTHAHLVADFREPDAVHAAVAAHVVAAGAIEILVNNTGGPSPGPIIDARPDDFTSALRMHLHCNQRLVQALLAGMKQRGYGRVINIISTSVRQPIPGLGVSNTTRAAVAAWAKTLAGELGPFGITVNSVLPGFTRTGRIDDLIRDRAAKQGVAPEEIERAMRREIPLQRFAEPSEIAVAVAFLASPEAGYITGVCLPVDGGRISAI
ncbi:MAG: SDR family oxidoreductase [Phycisphaerae bacterium]